ncbi:hypothetical protein LZ017_11270 [Pelomonas sp. CA6]|uniref:BPSS1780 family membrane protein n=1 Tax=Pelomonas sp. CA6 TaxID=2907999 RepID=UPI001F4BE821|nr:BPSS1780 family membrane protein [Pelomonas sp. CA6]MCH7343959.1 hypothetical protein [Pelomonas sp. CA6]
MMLHLQSVPARNGALWVRHGLKVLQRRPLALMGLMAAFLLCSGLVVALPFVGPFLMLAALPLVSLAFMLATHQVLQNQTPTLAIFAQPLQLTPQRRNTQLMLGSAYALCTVLIMMLSNWLDGGSFAAMQELLSQQEVDEKALEAALANPKLLTGMLSRFGLAALLSIPFWHAPALVHWGGQGAAQALFSSTLGVWRNKGAFALSALIWAALLMVASSALSLLVAALGLGRLMPLLAMPLFLAISAAFYGSLYFTFIDCFMFGAPRDVLADKPGEPPQPQP